MQPAAGVARWLAVALPGQFNPGDFDKGPDLIVESFPSDSAESIIGIWPLSLLSSSRAAQGWHTGFMTEGTGCRRNIIAVRGGTRTCTPNTGRLRRSATLADGQTGVPVSRGIDCGVLEAALGFLQAFDDVLAQVGTERSLISRSTLVLYRRLFSNSGVSSWRRVAHGPSGGCVSRPGAVFHGSMGSLPVRGFRARAIVIAR